MATGLILVVGVVAVTLTFVAIPLFFGKRILDRTLNGSGEHQARLQELSRTGQKARATVLSVTPTGTVINRVNLQCVLRFRLDPFDSSPSFEAEKTVYVAHGQVPRAGDVWPAWYDEANRFEFAVARPDPSDPLTAQRLQEFSITNPLAPMKSGSHVEALERLAELRADGMLSEAEFEAAKKQIIET